MDSPEHTGTWVHRVQRTKPALRIANRNTSERARDSRLCARMDKLVMERDEFDRLSPSALAKPTTVPFTVPSNQHVRSPPPSRRPRASPSQYSETKRPIGQPRWATSCPSTRTARTLFDHPPLCRRWLARRRSLDPGVGGRAGERWQTEGVRRDGGKEDKAQVYKKRTSGMNVSSILYSPVRRL